MTLQPVKITVVFNQSFACSTTLLYFTIMCFTKGILQMVIFDFDGVICNSFKSVILALRAIAMENGIKHIPQIDFEKLRRMETADIFVRFGFDKKEITRVVVQLLQKLSLQINTLKIVYGMQEVIKKLHDHKTTIGIVTSNSEENVSTFLKNYNVNDIDFIYSGTFFNKGEVLKKIAQENEICNSQSIFYVGDETRDILASREANLCSVSVTWGFNAEEVLMKYCPDYLVNTPEELAALLIDGENINYG